MKPFTKDMVLLVIAFVVLFVGILTITEKAYAIPTCPNGCYEQCSSSLSCSCGYDIITCDRGVFLPGSGGDI